MVALGCHSSLDVRLCGFKHGLMPCYFTSLNGCVCHGMERVCDHYWFYMFRLWPSALDSEIQVGYMLMTELSRTDLYKSSLVSRIKFWNIRLQEGSFWKVEILCCSLSYSQ